MKLKALFTLPLMFLCLMLLSINAYAVTDSDIEITVAAPVGSLVSESGVVATEQFPAEIVVNVTAKTGMLTGIRLEYNGQSREIAANHKLVVESKEACGPYTITAKTDKGAVLTITANIVFQVQAVYDVRYRTTGMNIKEVYEGGKMIKSFPTPQHVRLENANTVAEDEKERIAGLIGRSNGKTYILKGSLTVEIHNFATGKIYGSYDTDQDFVPLTTGYGWTKKALIAFETMRDAAISYQAPVKLDIEAARCDEKKQELYGKLTAQDKGVLEILYPYQTTSVTFEKDDIRLSRNFIYCGLEWDYTPECAAYADGESMTQTSITQPINYIIPATDFYFKFRPCEGNDLSVIIRAPAAVYRGDHYSFSLIYMNSGNHPVYDVLLKAALDDVPVEEIPDIQDFLPDESKTYTIRRTADTAADEIRLWANIGIPEGFVDANPGNNTAAMVIRVIDPQPEPEPEPTPEPGSNPGDPDNPGDNPDDPGDNPDEPGDNPDDPTDNPPDNPDNPTDPEVPAKRLCDVWVNLSSPPVVYEQEEYSFTVYFANSTGEDLSGVRLNVTINGEAVSDVPGMADFKAYEKKLFVVKATAKEKEANIQLLAQITPPAEYRDTNPANNLVTAKVMVLGRPYDLDVQRITPDRYKERQTVITTIKVGNKGTQDFTPGKQVIVLLQIPELAISKRLDTVVMEQDTWNVVAAKWETPSVEADKNITLIATINPDGNLNNESTIENNTYTQQAVILNVTYNEPEESRFIPVPPQRNDQPRVTWWEQRYENGQFVWKEFYAELKVTARLDYDTKAKGYLKSGYGFFISVTAAVDTNYDRPELITAAQTAEIYLPQYLYETAIPLMADSKNHFTFWENPSSPYKYKKQYVPVWFPDNKDYIMQLLVADVHTPGGTLARWITGGELKIFIKGDMYSDDITTGS